MKMTRKRFVSALAAFSAAAAFDPGTLLAEARPPVGLSAARFQPLLNTSFYARRDVDGLMIELVLTGVEELGSTGPAEQFRLQLLAVNGTLGEGTYTLEHPTFGSIRLFLAAAGSGPGGDRYRADFNLLKRTLPRAGN